MTRDDHRRSERGQVAVEVAVLFPGLLVLLFFVLQLGLWSVARSVATATADEGVRTGRAEGAGPAAGIDASRSFLRQRAGRFLTHTTVTAAVSTPDEIRIQVHGDALTVIPGHYPVSGQARGPVERYTTP